MEGQIGQEGVYDIKIEDGKVKISVGYKGSELDASLSIDVPARVYLDKLAAAIPGQIDDVILKALEAALGL